ncbi:uncharacterized protein METZ01_LOCUS394071 [marine metagenome]|uniref:Uncharacterized protein n=1 Tax=marine metagenome TaxID=408172 RepID=A0A382V455_9ZZZZ
MVRRLQDRFRTHLTLGYHTVKDTLRGLNHHRFDDDERDDDEVRVFFRYYHDAFFDLQRDIVDEDPFDIAGSLFDERRERFWTSVKLNDMSLEAVQVVPQFVGPRGQLLQFRRRLRDLNRGR